MKYIKLENNREIPYVQPLHVGDRLIFTSDSAILAEHDYYPLVEAEYPEQRAGYRIVRRIKFDTDHYDEIYEYVEIGEDDELTAEEAEKILSGETL